MDLSILKPVLVQVALTFLIQMWMAKERIGAIRAGSVVRNEPGVRPTWTGRAGTISNAFHNQLEVPMLFYAVVAFALIAQAGDTTMLYLAWAYVALRVVHAAIHTTYNYIPHRFAVYAFSNFVLIAMWAKLGAHVLQAG
jgi:hypothetical protein